VHRRYEDRLGLKPHENIGIRSWKCIQDMGVFWQLFVCSFGDVHFEQSLKIWDCVILASFLLCFQVSSFLNTRNSKRYLLWWTLYGQMWCTLGFSFFNWDLPLVSIYFSQMILYGMHGLSDWWYIFFEYLSLCAMMPKCCTSWGLWSYMPGLPGYQCLQTAKGAKSRNLGDGLIVVYWSVCRCQLLNNPWFVSFNFVM
jgi:hypothetical protein